MMKEFSCKFLEVSFYERLFRLIFTIVDQSSLVVWLVPEGQPYDIDKLDVIPTPRIRLDARAVERT